MRLQKYLASCGVASRRKCEEYILEGRVKVNGSIVNELGTKVQDGDSILFDDKKVSISCHYEYYMLNKPVGYVTTMKDEKNRPTVRDIMKDIPARIFPVGRLDYNTSGLLLLTNDGELTYALTHPKHHVGKTYHVKVKGVMDRLALTALSKGIMIDGKMTAPAKVSAIEINNTSCQIAITIYEGRNRQIRKMCEAVGHPVLKLRRMAIGQIRLNSLAEGEYRKLTIDEINYLKKVGGIHV